VDGAKDSDRPERHGANSLQRKRKEHIEQVLQLAGYDLEKAAGILYISVTELRSWMRKLEIQEHNGDLE